MVTYLHIPIDKQVKRRLKVVAAEKGCSLRTVVEKLIVELLKRENK
jgi:hypothetical protein